MDGDVNSVITPYKSKFFATVLCECILALLIIATVFTLKFFMPKTFKSAKKWYLENITQDTSAEEIVKGVYNETKAF
ncbi:MAG: hypothetical protein J5852_00790 [Clostridia bacterium]|nr:hypothetical protein [Clostridia bacterium]